MDKLFSLVDMSCEENLNAFPHLASHFVLVGQPAVDAIPVHFAFLSKGASRTTIFEMKFEVERVPENEFFICWRIVNENQKTNAALLIRLSEDSALVYAMPYPT